MLHTATKIPQPAAETRHNQIHKKEKKILVDGVFHFLLWSSKLPLAFLVSSAARKGKTELCFGCAHLEL